MSGGILVAAHLSSLFPSAQLTSVPLYTSRRNTPLPSEPIDSDPPAEHASFSTTLHTPTTGTILLRVLHAGLILELISLSTDVPPIRFVFPAPILPSPAIFLCESDEIHVLAVTKLGSLYRLVLPGTRKLWHDQVMKNWCREHLIQYTSGAIQGVVHIPGIHTVAIGLPNGSILRLETETLGDDDNDDQWIETPFQHGSFFSSLTNFLPTLSSGNSDSSEIVSMASHPQPTDIGHVWTLSRDRTLRLWTAKSGCVSAKRIPLNSLERAVSLVPGNSHSHQESIPHILLEAEPQRLLRVFTSSLSPEKDQHFVLAFSPTISSLQSGGFFQLFSTDADYLHPVATIQCSSATAHCYLQDFIVVNGNMLFTLWDRQGQSRVEKMTLSTGQMMGQTILPSWLTASYPPEPELTPAYLDDLLLSPGSMTDKFLEAILTPGMFSTLTLNTAVDQYTTASLSLPGPTPPRLTAIYGSTSEHIAAVVGSTVTLNRDPHTGALQHANYWNALKRDWEGFIARCREVERSARWPLALGVGDRSEIIIMERDRSGNLVPEDYALQMHRLLSAGVSVEPQPNLLDMLWGLRTKLSQQLLLNIESRLVEIHHQDIAFPLADIVNDEARRCNFVDSLDPGLEDWMRGRLQSIDNLDVAIHSILDVIGGFDQNVKIEEVDEAKIPIPTTHSEWAKALVATYAINTIHARYDLSMSLMILLFFVSEDLIHWEPVLLAEIFAVFRGIAMLRFLAKQPVGPTANKIVTEGGRNIDAVASRLRDPRVSERQSRFLPTYSLIHCLASDADNSQVLPGAAHRFLDTTALLQSTSPAHVGKPEVLFCEQLRLLGHYEMTREMLAWLPRTPGISYVTARLWLSVGRVDDAAYILDKLAGTCGLSHGLSVEDGEALAAVLPGAHLFESDYAFYQHAASLFASVSHVGHDVRFSQLALSVASNEYDTADEWYRIIKGLSDLALYKDAYSSLVACPIDKLKRECVSELVYRMCEDNAVEQLMTFNFANFADEVEDALAFKARNADPRTRPFYSRILYTWYTSRGDYRNAALTMYQRVRKLQDLIADPLQQLALVEDQLEAYMITMNALSLLDQSSAWIALPITVENSSEPRKRRKLSKYVPENKFATGKHDSEIITLADIRYDYVLLQARLDLAQKDRSLFSYADFLLAPCSIILKLAQANRFNTAMAIARSLDVDMTELFAHLTTQTLRLSRNLDTVMQEDTSDWLLTDKVSSWPGTHTDRSWRYLRVSLERHDNKATCFKYSNTVLETILALDRIMAPPPWLTQILAEYHAENLIRVMLRYDRLEYALEHTASLVRKTDADLARAIPQNAASTWLPYALLDQVLTAARSENKLSSRASAMEKGLQIDIAKRTKRMQKLSQFPG